MKKQFVLQVLPQADEALQGKNKNLVLYNQARKMITVATPEDYDFVALDAALRSTAWERQTKVAQAACGHNPSWAELFEMAGDFDYFGPWGHFERFPSEQMIPNPDLDGDDAYVAAPHLHPFAGSSVLFPLGEGMLDFLYADFGDGWLEKVTYENGHTPPKGFLCQTPAEQRILDCLRAAYTTKHFSKAIRSSIYTTVCPPFMETWTREKFGSYLAYLRELQKALEELLTFVFDADYYPDILGGMTEGQRYLYFCAINGCTAHYEYTYSFNDRTFLKRNPVLDFMRLPALTIDPGDHEFYRRYASSEVERDLYRKQPTASVEGFTCACLEDLLMFELRQMLDSGVKLRKCKRCGKFFVMKGNYDTNYCDRIQEGETRTCQQIAAQDNYKKKMADNAAIPVYQKYYKRYAARVRVKQLKEADFKKWKYEAIRKRDECADGKITLQELIDWMEGAFPNRKRK